MTSILSLFPPGLVVTDGAWGTELQKRGLALGVPPDGWNLTRPDDVEAVASSYVEAGSRVILTNTFRGNPVALAAIGLADRVRDINRRGVELSRRAAGSSARVFASAGPIGRAPSTGEIDVRGLLDAFRLQTEALAEGGADAILFETFGDIEEARLAVRAARPTGLPVVVSFSFGCGADGERTYMGATPAAVGRAMAEEGASAVGANCGSDLDAFVRICRRLRESSGLPVWIKPSAGLPRLEGGHAVYATTPEDLARSLPALVEAGASFVGACCGTSPEFIVALVRAARAYAT